MTDSDWETAKVTRGMNMANNCGFQVVLCGHDVDSMRRVCDIINDRDPEYAVVRTWRDCAYILGETENRVTIAGECPWTADYYWRPDETLAGYGCVPGESREDKTGRIFVSIPYLCQLWDLVASGYEEEWGCCVDGEYRAYENGHCDYIDTWGDQCITHMQNDPDDSWRDCLEEAIADGRCEGRVEEARALIEAYDAEDD